MGAGNVKAAYAVWAPHLGDPAFKLLVFMALTALDEDDPPLYWGGRESLAIGLGRRPPLTDADERAIDRAMKQLRAVGAIHRVRHSAPGTTARHQLHLSPDAARRVNNELQNVDTRRAASSEHPTPRDGNTRRTTSEHPTPRDATPDVPRRPDEDQDQPRLTDDPPITSERNLEQETTSTADEVTIARPSGADRARAELHATRQAAGQ